MNYELDVADSDLTSDEPSREGWGRCDDSNDHGCGRSRWLGSDGLCKDCYVEALQGLLRRE